MSLSFYLTCLSVSVTLSCVSFFCCLCLSFSLSVCLSHALVSFFLFCLLCLFIFPLDLLCLTGNLSCLSFLFTCSPRRQQQKRRRETEDAKRDISEENEWQRVKEGERAFFQAADARFNQHTSSFYLGDACGGARCDRIEWL